MMVPALFGHGPIDLKNKPPENIKWALTYCNPDGEESPPRPDTLREIIYEQGPDYYSNAGGAGLYGSARDGRGVLVYSAHNTPFLCWFLVEPFGVSFQF